VYVYYIEEEEEEEEKGDVIKVVVRGEGEGGCKKNDKHLKGRLEVRKQIKLQGKSRRSRLR